MKSKVLILALATVALGSCTKECYDSASPNTTETRSLDSFTRVSLEMGAKVILEEGSESQITIEGPSDLMEVIDTRVVGNELIIDYNVDCVENSPMPILHIVSSNFSKLDVSGYADLSSADTLHAGSFNIDISGSLDGSLNLMATDVELDVSGSCGLTLYGESELFDCNTSGSADLFLFDFTTNKTGLNISGTNYSELTVASNLDVRVSGSAEILYYGAADVNSNISGTATITNLP